MGIQDLIITPIYIVLLTLMAYFIRPYVTNRQTRKYFLPALWVRFAGAIALGLIYQFYYGFGGDTMNFYRQAGVVYEALLNNPSVGLKLLIADTTKSNPDLFEYSSRIYWFRSSTEYILIKIIGVLDLFTFRTYTATALFFASFSFAGSWMMYRVFQNRFYFATKPLVVAILFIPSCIFWGSGILKDTITLGALGLIIWGVNKVIYEKKVKPVSIMITIISAWLIYTIKIYILLCFIPAVFVWWYFENIRRIKGLLMKIFFVPVLALMIVLMGFYSLQTIADTSNKYNLDAIAERAYITAYDIRYFSGRAAGSGYDIGAQDGSFTGLLKLFPNAVNVSLFRPYLWEVRNPLMVLSALEAVVFLVLSIKILLRFNRPSVRKVFQNPMVKMCLIFSLAFAFAVGVSTYNFGSLSRYKIPLLPFYATAIAILIHGSKVPRKHKSPSRNEYLIPS